MSNAMVAIVVGLLAGGHQSSTVQGPLAAFSVVVETTSTGWLARCDSGCTWREVSFACATACDAILGSTGLFSTATLPPRPTSFLFVLTRTRTGICAEARQGTLWSRLSWSCGAATNSCRVAVDASGVRGAN